MEGDSIEASAGGRLTLKRPRMSGERKVCRFWLHFMSMPVHVGAATSPQSMQNTVVIE